MPNQMQDALIEALSTIPTEPEPFREDGGLEPDKAYTLEELAGQNAKPEPAAPETPAEPPKAEPVVEARVEPERVPLAVLLDERAQKREAFERARRAEEELAQLRAAQVKPEEPAPPALADDPVANLDARMKANEETTRKALEEAQASREALKLREQIDAMDRALSQTEAQFVAQNSDYFDALNHARQVRAHQIKMLIPDSSDQQIAQQIGQEEKHLAQTLLMRGVNPAQFVYETAKAMGYAKREPKTEEPKADNVVPIKAEPDRDAVRSLGSGQAAVVEPDDTNPLDGLLATVRKERGFKR